MSLPVPISGEVYQHYKGGYYLIEGVARHSESGEYMVVYRCLYHRTPACTDEPTADDEGIPFGALNVRPLDLWLSPVDEYRSVPDGVPSLVGRKVRFQRVDYKVWP